MLLGTAVVSHAQLDSPLRIWKVYDDSFDLTLTSVFKGDGENLTASLNHRRGRTFFVSEGERVGPYSVISLARSGKYSASAMLRDTRTSALHELSLNTPLKLPGLRAQIVDTETGLLWDVRKQDEIASLALKVTDISATKIRATLLTGSLAITEATDEERSAVEKMWRDAEKHREEAGKAARQAREEKSARELAALQALAKAKAQARRPALSVQTTPKLFFGTEYRYPKSWAYYYTFEPGPSGVRAHPRVIAIPTEFETRMTGWGINVAPDER